MRRKVAKKIALALTLLKVGLRVHPQEHWILRRMFCHHSPIQTRLKCQKIRIWDWKSKMRKISKLPKIRLLTKAPRNLRSPLSYSKTAWSYLPGLIRVANLPVQKFEILAKRRSHTLNVQSRKSTLAWSKFWRERGHTVNRQLWSCFPLCSLFSLSLCCWGGHQAWTRSLGLRIDLSVASHCWHY